MVEEKKSETKEEKKEEDVEGTKLKLQYKKEENFSKW